MLALFVLLAAAAPAPSAPKEIAPALADAGTPDSTDSKPDSSDMADMPDMPDMSGMKMDMSQTGPSGAQFPHSREGSGTSWGPDSAPIYGHHWMVSGWMLMLHYALIAGYDDQWSDRGSRRFASTNWIMGMAQHSLFGGQLLFRTMLSAEPLTLGGPLALPLLLQTGETYDGQPLHDRQHPHDLFMEVAAIYRHALAPELDGLGLELYAAPSGEPALGPTAFMHRLSAMSNPFPPISHHWQDSTHISFPVFTAGIYNHYIKVEGSIFHGREPDEDRWNFDFGRLDSWSVRASANPLRELSLEVSYGYLHSPEALYPLDNEHRVIGSVEWNHALFSNGDLALTAVYGRKLEPEAKTNSFLLEAQLDLDGFDVPFARFEWVQKLGQDLVVPGDPDAIYPVNELVLGYQRRLPQLGPIVPVVGIAANIDFIPRSLEGSYGTQIPFGGFIYVGLQPPKLRLGE